ncbi:hypothetical protein ABIB89_003188 [Bradyrhizobium sp. JR3.12]
MNYRRREEAAMRLSFELIKGVEVLMSKNGISTSKLREARAELEAVLAEDEKERQEHARG